MDIGTFLQTKDLPESICDRAENDLGFRITILPQSMQIKRESDCQI